MAAFVYEGVLLFGVVMAVGFLYGMLMQQRNALHDRNGLQAVLFVVIGIYFVWFWTHGGQTVAMKAWRLRLLRRDGGPVNRVQALCRYLLCWVWFLPALGTAYGLGPVNGAAVVVLVLGGVVIYALLSRLLPDGQFLHDVLCGTRLLDTQEFSS
jgi:uncharacterized RDD family membrane protein YckC